MTFEPKSCWLLPSADSQFNKIDCSRTFGLPCKCGLIPKVFSTFQNTGCIGNGGRNGTCYTSDECEDRNGLASGSCAEGYGVCCIGKNGTTETGKNKNLP